MNRLILHNTLTQTTLFRSELRSDNEIWQKQIGLLLTVLKNTKYAKRAIKSIQHTALKTMNLYQGFNEENYSVQTYVQKLSL